MIKEIELSLISSVDHRQKAGGFFCFLISNFNVDSQQKAQRWFLMECSENLFDKTLLTFVREETLSIQLSVEILSPSYLRCDIHILLCLF